MSSNYADMLAAKYIKSAETDGSQIFHMMELFDTSRDNFKAMRALSQSSMTDVALNYQPLLAYSRSLTDNYILQK